MKYGHWDERVEERTDWDGNVEKITRYYCSECGSKETIKSDYCRKCGARLDGRRDPTIPRYLGCDISLVFGKRQYNNGNEVYYDDVPYIFLNSGEYVVMNIIPRNGDRTEVLLTPMQARTVAKILLKLSGDKC